MTLGCVTKTEFVVGFMFLRGRRSVLLLEKQRPEWQKGLFNGLGGKIEPGETPHQAMVREFREETGGAVTFESEWKLFCTLNCSKSRTKSPGEAVIYFFYAERDQVTVAKGSDEVVMSVLLPPLLRRGRRRYCLISSGWFVWR